jgi:phosphoserine phosphatase
MRVPPRRARPALPGDDQTQPHVAVIELEQRAVARVPGTAREIAPGPQGRAVFGDGINDLDMFRDADHAIAVENAGPEVIAVASEIAGRNDQDGVVRWIAAARIAGRV